MDIMFYHLHICFSILSAIIRVNVKSNSGMHMAYIVNMQESKFPCVATTNTLSSVYKLIYESQINIIPTSIDQTRLIERYSDICIADISYPRAFVKAT